MSRRNTSLKALATSQMMPVASKSKKPEQELKGKQYGRFFIIDEDNSPPSSPPPRKSKKGGVTPYQPAYNDKRMGQQGVSPYAALSDTLIDLEDSPGQIEKDYKRNAAAAAAAAQKKQSPIKPTNLEDKFKNLQNGGTVQYEGGSYVVHTGPRGGKYIQVKNKKIYLPSKQKK